MAGFLLAELGAEVIAVEPPGGQRARHVVGPFASATADPECSLTHWAYNRGKLSVVLRDEDHLIELAAGADAVIDCGVHDIDLAGLRQHHPHLVTVSISAFGASGPKADWAATDLTIAAASGTLSITGDEDRAPVRVGVPQTWGFAALDAACAVLLALKYRNASGHGQHADISAQQSYVSTSQFQMMGALVGKPRGMRIAGGMRLGNFQLQIVHPCRDGYVTAAFLFGAVFGPYTTRLFKYIHDSGGCDASWVERDWVEFGNLLVEGDEAMGLVEEGIAIMRRFLMTRTKVELFADAADHQLLIAPILTSSDLTTLAQLDARDWWQEIDGVIFPGTFVKAPAAPSRVPCRAPRIGEHDDQIIPRSPSLTKNGDDPQLPLSGLCVLDFSWALAAPGATRILADHGATVVRVESQTKPDAVRGATPFIGEDGVLENSLHWHSPNAGKLGLTLNLSHPQAREVVFDLARWADVVVESFSTGTMARFGIGYDDLKAVNPKVIMLSSCLLGQTGPLRAYAGFGTAGAAIAGFYPLTGWPDRQPAGPFGAYSDYSSPRFSVVALLAALEWRQRTGEGQHLDYAQLEGAVQLMTPVLLDETVNGRTAGRHGNADPDMAPHGVYPVAGEDTWISVACETDGQWRALAELIGDSAQADLDTRERLQRREQLDELVADWAASRDGAELEHSLQAVGVPAHRVAFAEDVVTDPQLVHRGQFVEVPHPVHGTSWAEGSPIAFSQTQGVPRWAGPTFGQHLHEVLFDELGYDADRVADLLADGVLD